MKNYIIALATFILFAPMVTHAAAKYRVTDLGTLGGNTCRAYGVNDQGHVVGESYLADGRCNAFIWKDGKMTDLGTLGGNGSSASRINNSDIIVGWARPNDNNYQACVWQNGIPSQLSNLGGVWSTATDINSNGEIAGYCRTPGGMWHACIWNDGTLTDVNPLNGHETLLCAVNNYGAVFGIEEYYNDGTWIYCPVISCNGVSQYQPLLSTYTTASVCDMNDLGQMVGSCDGASNSNAVIWQNGSVTNISGSLRWARANAINNKGQVVGAFGGSYPGNAAFLWQNGTLTDLNSLIEPASGLTLVSAQDISNQGYIAAWGYVGGQTHAFLLTPVPEPSSILVLLCGFGGMGGMIWKRMSV